MRRHQEWATLPAARHKRGVKLRSRGPVWVRRAPLSPRGRAEPGEDPGWI